MSAISVLLAGACAETAAFSPTENVRAVSPSGVPAAAYDIRTGRSQPARIHVNVWSEGAETGDDRTYVDLAVSLRNTGDRVVWLEQDALALEAFTERGAPLPRPQLVRITSEKRSIAVAPDQANTLRLRYAIPAAVPATDIGSLRLRWSLALDDGQQYTQFTEFRQYDEWYAGSSWGYYSPIYGYYDPFFYGGFGYYGHHIHHVPTRRVIVQQRDRPSPRPAPHARR